MTLTHDFALELVTKAVTAAKQKDTSIAVVVVDTGGRTVASLRMDGVNFVPYEIARRKAVGGMAFGGPTIRIGEFMGNDPKLASLFNMDEFSLIGGGWPIILDGMIVGGFGVAGGHYAVDDQVAQTALGLAS
jgi:glc operon protein GlcG